MTDAAWSQTGFREAFLADERHERVRSGRVACALVSVLVPLGWTLDLAIYPNHAAAFLGLRLLCSVLSVAIWWLYYTPLAAKYHRFMGMTVALLPAFFISWMIAVSEGAASPYYAGLNLILVGVSTVLRWSLLESSATVGLVLCMYLVAAFWRPHSYDPGIFYANCFFLVTTGIIVVAGNSLFNRLRFREFSLRFELDRSRRMLEEGNRRLRELDEAKSRFFANISHELRTPLTLLLAPLEALLARSEQFPDDQVRAWLTTMHANGMRLLKLINDLLDLVRLESGKTEVRREPLDVPAFIEGLTQLVRKVAEDKRLNLTTHLGAAIGWAEVDRDKLEKVLLNLLFNAIKFTPASGQVSLAADREAEELVVRVADTGIGISERHLASLFQRFWQADTSSQRRYQGAGLGLALVKELVEIQGGTVGVRSAEGRGTTITVRLPYLPADPAEAAPGLSDAAPSETSPAWLASLYRRAQLFPVLSSPQAGSTSASAGDRDARPSLLLADDEPDMLRFLRSQLQGEFRLWEATDGRQAVAAARQHLPDLVLCDMMMPELDGLQVCRELRQDPATQHVPIVLLTARADEAAKLAALSAGASDFITKPFSTTELHVRLVNLLDAYRVQRQLARQNQLLESTLAQLKETEAQLVQSEKMASLGRMCAGIMHEVNNPLNYVKTGMYTLGRTKDLLPASAQPEYAETLADIEDGLDRLAAIVGDLRVFAHPDGRSFAPVSLAKTVQAALRLLSHEWKDRVRIVEDVPALLQVHGNANKLVHVVVNLLQNALDSLRSARVQGHDPTIWIEGRAEPGRLLLCVRDNGAGIATGHVGQIFEPFFTTKDVGQGMGLGLSICYQTMEEHRGRISARSEPGRGAEFVLEFPERI
jgi:signal transduction histidine kinase